MITICIVYFKSLTLKNLAAALFSVRQQDLSLVQQIVLLDNDTGDSTQEISHIVNELQFPVPVTLMSYGHRNNDLTHAWSTNTAVGHVDTTWVLFTRADYLLDPEVVKKFTAAVHDQEYDHVRNWQGFITANGCHLQVGIEAVEKTDWRVQGPRILHGIEYDYTEIDTGVWMMKKETFDAVEGLNEDFTAWGHAQTEFQHRLFLAGVEFVRIPEVLFYHAAHGGEKDIDLAHAQLAEQGLDLKEMWKRYHGVSPYGA